MSIKNMLLIFFNLLLVSYTRAEHPLHSYDRDANNNGQALDDVESVQRWYIKKATGECTEFQYLGKGLDFNNFKSENECNLHKTFTLEEQLEECKKVNESYETYTFPPISKCEGTGEIRYYYKRHYIEGMSDVETYSCEEFRYKGCGTSANNFKTREECMRICQPQLVKDENALICRAKYAKFKHETGKDLILRAIPLETEKKCVMSYIINDENSYAKGYVSVDQCVKACFADNLENNVKCKGNAYTGECNGKFVKRYYFDTFDHTCEQYISKECSIPANKNSFETLSDCIGTCPSKNENNELTEFTFVSDLCSQNKDVGEGELIIPQFYFDFKTKECLHFVYHGRGGNSNRFESLNVCKAICTNTPIPSDEHFYKVEKMDSPTEISEKEIEHFKTVQETVQEDKVTFDEMDDPEIPELDDDTFN